MKQWWVKDWRDGWKWLSVQAAAALVLLQLLQEQVLPLVGFAIPAKWFPYVNAGVGLTIIVFRFVQQQQAEQQKQDGAFQVAMRTIDEYRKWLGHEFPEVDRVLENLEAELRGEALNAGTPQLSDNCVLSSLREQLRRRARARAVIEPTLLLDGAMPASFIGRNGDPAQGLTIDRVDVIPSLQPATQRGAEPERVLPLARSDDGHLSCSMPYLRESAISPWFCGAPSAPAGDTTSSDSTDSTDSSGSSVSAGGSD